MCHSLAAALFFLACVITLAIALSGRRIMRAGARGGGGGGGRALPPPIPPFVVSSRFPEFLVSLFSFGICTFLIL